MIYIQPLEMQKKHVIQTGKTFTSKGVQGLECVVKGDYRKPY
jgi:hypothetical protein